MFLNLLMVSTINIDEPIEQISFSSSQNATTFSQLFNDIIKKICEGLLILHFVSGISEINKELRNYSL